MTILVDLIKKISPEWTEIWRVPEIEHNLKIEFRGPGWYISDSDSVLISELSDDEFLVMNFFSPHARKHLLDVAHSLNVLASQIIFED